MSRLRLSLGNQVNCVVKEKGQSGKDCPFSLFGGFSVSSFMSFEPFLFCFTVSFVAVVCIIGAAEFVDSVLYESRSFQF